ncbi:MAG: BMP family ABC transporter substrate-binding protein, partial [Ilumatobacteraceae bacterium]
MKKSRLSRMLAVTAAAGLVLAACGGNSGDSSESDDSGVLNVVAAYSSAIEEPWDGVIHEALTEAADDGEITYKYIDKIGYASGALERT